MSGCRVGRSNYLFAWLTLPSWFCYIFPEEFDRLDQCKIQSVTFLLWQQSIKLKHWIFATFNEKKIVFCSFSSSTSLQRQFYTFDFMLICYNSVLKLLNRFLIIFIEYCFRFTHVMTPHTYHESIYHHIYIYICHFLHSTFDSLR